MDIVLSNKAIEFYKRELNITEGKGIRIKAKAYGSTNVHTYFSVAIEVSKPRNPFALVEEDDLMVFIEKSEEWFVEGLDLEIDYDAEEDVPTYYFLAQDDRILDNSEYKQNYPSQHIF